MHYVEIRRCLKEHIGSCDNGCSGLSEADTALYNLENGALRALCEAVLALSAIAEPGEGVSKPDAAVCSLMAKSALGRVKDYLTRYPAQETVLDHLLRNVE